MQIYFLLTDNCNLKCSMCIRGKQHGNNVNIDNLKRIIHENDFSMDDIVITGGEPSLHKDYCDIVQMMSANSKTVTVTTNGTLDLRYEELKELNNIFFQVSIDGDKDVHNAIRGKGSFELTWENIKKLDASNIQYSIASVVGKKNKETILSLLPLLEKLKKLRFWRISYEMPFGSASGTQKMMTAQEWNDFVDILLQKARLRVKIQKIFPFDLYEKRKTQLENNFKKRNVNCGSGISKLYIYPNFDVYPCTCLTDFCIGNINKQSFEEIITGEKIKIFSEYQLSQESACQECEYKKFCNGGCIGMSYHYFGKLGMGDLRCPKINL